MAEFIINTEVKTETATVEVTLSPQRPLALGRHTFRLVVVGGAVVAEHVPGVGTVQHPQAHPHRGVGPDGRRDVPRWTLPSCFPTS